MSKTSRIEFLNRENDQRKGKITYRKRLIEEYLTAQELEEQQKESTQEPDEQLLQTYQTRG